MGLVTMLAMAAFVTTSTTISVENNSHRKVILREAKIPGHYDPDPHKDIGPRGFDRLASRSGKILVPPGQGSAEAVRLVYADTVGNGCIFHLAPIEHSASWTELRPAAEPMGDAQCEARTGRTRGDYIYVVR